MAMINNKYRLIPLKKIIRSCSCSARPLIIAPSSSSSITTVDPPPPPPRLQIETKTGDDILKLDDAKEIFGSVPTGKLIRSAMNLQVAACGPMVDAGIKVMKSKSLMEMPVLGEMVKGCVKHTLYDHFCAGEDPAAAGRVIASNLIWESGLRGMLDYGLENATDNDSCDNNLRGFLQTIQSTNSLPPSSVSFVIVKITAICPLKLLKKVSDLLRWEYKDKSSSHLPWKVDCLPIFSKSSPLYHTPTKPEPLTREEEADLELGMERLHMLCQKCLDDAPGVPLLFDAEDTAVQPAIDYFVYSAAVSYNRDDNPVVFGTMQTYLKDAEERLFATSAAADKMGIPMGFKLVRGAYMSTENIIASSMGAQSPIHNSIQHTHACFDQCASFLLRKIACSPGKLVLATHNIESAKLATIKARELGVEKMGDKLQFAQLYGMADTLSYGLRNAGFQVSKYMPFGPVDQIMPYLIRRAEENRGLLSTSTHDRQLMKVELLRRLKATILREEDESEKIGSTSS